MQEFISKLITIQSLSKEVHWNARGRGFLYIHPYLDEIYENSLAFIDELAEYMVASQAAVPRWYGEDFDSFPQSVLSDNNIITGLRQVREQVNELVESLDDAYEGLDPVGADIITRLQATFEKHLWFLTAELR